MKKILMAVSAAVMAVAPMAAADAHRVVDRYGYSIKHNHGHGRYHRGYESRRYDDRRYSDRYYSQRTWRGRDGRMYCRRADGTVGLIVGGAAGALAGRAIDTHGERATGTIAGAVLGAIIGRQATRCR